MDEIYYLLATISIIILAGNYFINTAYFDRDSRLNVAIHKKCEQIECAIIMIFFTVGLTIRNACKDTELINKLKVAIPVLLAGLVISGLIICFDKKIRNKEARLLGYGRYFSEPFSIILFVLSIVISSVSGFLIEYSIGLYENDDLQILKYIIVVIFLVLLCVLYSATKLYYRKEHGHKHKILYGGKDNAYWVNGTVIAIKDDYILFVPTNSTARYIRKDLVQQIIKVPIGTDLQTKLMSGKIVIKTITNSIYEGEVVELLSTNEEFICLKNVKIINDTDKILIGDKGKMYFRRDQIVYYYTVEE